MTRGRRVQQRPKCRDIMSYFAQPKKQPTASPPRKKQRLQPLSPCNPKFFYSSVVSPSPIPPSPTSISHPLSPHLHLTPPSVPPPPPSVLPLFTPPSVPPPPPPSVLPPLTPPPVPPPPSSSLLPPLTSPPVPPPPSTSHLPPLPLPSLLSPPPTPSLMTEFSIVDDVESLLMTRSIPFHPECGADEVKLFTRSQMCLVDSLLNQLDHMGLTPERLHRLVDYLHLSLSPTRMPSAHVMYRLWNMTSNLEVVVHRLGVDAVAKVSSLFHTMLSLHPPGSSHTAHHQYQQFVRHLGTAKEVFAAWLHIKQLLNAQYYKYFHQYIAFLVDLLLSDFWSYITNAQQVTVNPMFVSVFWSAPTAASTMSLPIRQLLEIIHHMLVSYSGTEMELSVLQSCMALLFLVTTRCQDITVELSLLTQKLSNKSFLLFISLLYPLRLHALMFAVHLTQSRLQPPLQLPHSFSSNLPHSPSSNLPHSPSNSLPHSPSSNLPKINSLNITGEFLSPVKNCSSPHKGQNKSLSMKRNVTKRRRSQYYVLAAKRRLCENCDTGTVICHRCQ